MTGNRQVRFLGECERATFQSYPTRAVGEVTRLLTLIEKLNLAGLSRKNKPKTDETGKFLPNGQSAKSGLNKSWADAAFGQPFPAQTRRRDAG